MITIRRWRQNAPSNTDHATRTQGFRVRELRPLNGHSCADENAKEKGGGKAQATRKEQGESEVLTFLLAPSLLRALNPLLRFLGRKPIPCEPATSGMREHKCKPLRIGEHAPVVGEQVGGAQR